VETSSPTTSGDRVGTESVREKADWLSFVEKLSQIVLVVVAVFGYFYTVKPIYQKDRLEEQVAEYEGILKEQRPKVAALETQLKSLAAERDFAKGELEGLERSLNAARQEKKQLQNQTRYMEYKYYTAEGMPAVTDKQVADAQGRGIEASYLSSIKMFCGLIGIRTEEFGSFRSSKDMPKDEFYPFTKKEMAIWSSVGAKLVVDRALSCVKAQSASYSRKYADDPAHKILIAAAEKVILQNISERATKNPWRPKVEPKDIIAEHRGALEGFKRRKAEEVAKAEKDYGGWENVWGDARRTIAKQNYETAMKNAEIKAWSDSFGANYAAESKANDFAQSLNKASADLVHASISNQ